MLKIKALVFVQDETHDDDGAYHFDKSDTPSEWHMPVDHVMIGNGTLRGFVYLTEDYIPE